MRTCIILPTYNERDNITRIIPALFALPVPHLHVLVVDDSSPDGTARVVQQFKKHHRNLHVLNRPAKQGLGAAYIAGITHALATIKPDVIFEMDADFSHNPSDIPRMLAALTCSDVVIGSRYVRGGRIRGWNTKRHILSATGNLLARTLIGLPVRDCTAGFRAWRATTLQSLNLTTLGTAGYAFQISILAAARRKHARITELPVTFIERQVGTSKLGTRDIKEFVLTCLRLA